MTTILVQDQSTDGYHSEPKKLTLLSEDITVREILRSRVYQEVQDYNAKCEGAFQGLVQPTQTAQSPNGFIVPKGRKLDWKDQFTKACEAFETNSIIVLIGNHQADALDEVIHLRSQHETVTFLRLVPLVGG